MRLENHCLRVALVFHGTIFEERTFTVLDEPTITLGERGECDFALSSSRLPEQLEVFSRDERGYFFRFPDGVDLDLHVNGGDFRTEELLEEYRAARVGTCVTAEGTSELLEVMLRVNDWGVMRMGATSLFFQVVSAQAVVGGRPAGDSVDRSLVMTLAVALLLHLGFLFAAFLQPPAAEFVEIRHHERVAHVMVEDVDDAVEEVEPEPEIVEAPAEAAASRAEAAPLDTEDHVARGEESSAEETVAETVLDALNEVTLAEGALAGLFQGEALDAVADIGFAEGEDGPPRSRQGGGGPGIRGDRSGPGLLDIGEAPVRADGDRPDGVIMGQERPNVGIDVDDEPPHASDFCAPEDIRRVVHARANAIRSCFERELQVDPTLHGQVTMAWRIQPDGSVQQVTVSESTLRNRSVEGCISRVVERMRFVEPDGGGVCAVRYPFVFSGVQ